MAKSFFTVKDLRLDFQDKLLFGKYINCRVCDILPFDYEYILWLESVKPGTFKVVVLEEARSILTEMDAERHLNEEIKPYLNNSVWYTDDDVPF
jgi:hypothetical protein